MSGKTVVITGATNGIGRAAALALGAMGARLVLVCRDKGRGEAVVSELAARGAKADLLLADLAEFAPVRSAAREVLRLAPRIDVLVNNAGAIFEERSLTADGYERTFALNHLSYFLLTRLLLDRIKESAPARIVNVASRAHWRAKGVDLDDLKGERSYSSWRRYGESKLANILFTRELSRRLAGTGVTANSLHPGVVATGFGRNSKGLMNLMVRLAAPFLITPEKGAETIVYLASSPQAAGVTGKYFVRCAEARTTAAAQDDDAARRLWELSERVTGGV
ncbi:MAG: SDR family oxidoreductase [Elusimicrobia bacterium]|nr:SDR family oxidoreductase [Elusimicrobiota bacterium]